MKTWWDRMIRGAILAATLVTATLTSTPLAQAAAVYIVDDDSSAACAPTYNSISHTNPLQDAIDDATTNKVKTILVCPGVYRPFTVSSNTVGLTIKALDPADKPRIDAPLAHGIIVNVSDSKNIVLDGLYINGTPFDDTDTASMTGILFQNTSGTIQNNLIFDLRNHPTQSAAGYGVDIENYNSTSVKVTVKNNMFSAFGQAAVYAYGQAKLTISGNHIDGANGDTSSGYPGYGIDIEASNQGVPTGTVTKNLIYFVGTGLYLNEVNSFKVTGNVFRQNLYDGVFINSQCAYLGGGTGTTANKNNVSGNSFLQMQTGIDVYSTSSGYSNCPPRTNYTVISKNTFSANALNTGAPISLVAQKLSTDLPGIDKTKVTNNTAWGFGQMIEITETNGTGMVTHTVDSHNTVVHP